MMTVGALRRYLLQFPDSYRVYAYEGERTGVVVVSEYRSLAEADPLYITEQFGFAPCSEYLHDPALESPPDDIIS